MNITELNALHDHVIVTDMNFDERKTSSGIILRKDDGKQEGIRPRWAKVVAIGPNQQDVSIGQYVLVEHGRWTRGSKVVLNGTEIVVRRVDVDALMCISDEEPSDDYVNIDLSK